MVNQPAMKLENFVKWTKKKHEKLKTCNNAIGAIFGIETELQKLKTLYGESSRYRCYIDMENVKRTVGYLMFHIANLCYVENIDLEDAILWMVNDMEEIYNKEGKNESK